MKKIILIQESIKTTYDTALTHISDELYELFLLTRLLPWIKLYDQNFENYGSFNDLCIARPDYEPEMIYIYELFDAQAVNGDFDKTPKLGLSKKNYLEIIQQWKQVLKQQPNYVIIKQLDSGEVQLEMKDQLHQDELQLIEEYKKKINNKI